MLRFLLEKPRKLEQKSPSLPLPSTTMANEFSNFPPNLDDGELWLPSDIFRNEIPSNFNPHRHRPPFSCTDDDLASRFAALSLPNHHRKPPKAANFERHKEPVRYGSGYGRTGFEMSQSLNRLKNGPFLGPVYPFQLLKPTQAQVESYVEARAELQRQQNRLFHQNRDFPFQANSSNNYKFGLGGGLVRVSGGTGVFHPRIVDFKKERSLKINRESPEIRVGQRTMNSSKRVDVMKQEDSYYHLPPGMGLPRDWTCM